MNNIDDEKREEIAAEDADELDEEDEELGEDEEIDADGVLDEDENFDDDATNEIATVEEELSQKEQNARSLAIRRAIEQQMDQKRLDEDLDFLDLDKEE